jgi:methyltransferase (TIGR00027 family)
LSLPKYSISTADWVAGARAWHLRNTVALFEDPYAEVLAGPALRLLHWIRPLEWLVFKIVLKPILPASMCVLMRARYAEESLERAIEAGIRQYVILGAGMDSFAFRRADLLDRIRIFEIDHPVTQAKKLQRIRRHGLEVPPNHQFIAADLSNVSPAHALAETLFDASEPAFVSLLGVCYYLTRDAMTTTLRGIAEGMHPGTRIVLDYMLDAESSDPETHGFRARMLDFVKKRGEPMRSAYSMDAMNALMTDSGFGTLENFRMTDLTEAYTKDLEAVAVEPPDLFAFGNFEVR